MRGGDVPDAEFLTIVRERVARSSRPIWFNEPGSSVALGPKAWDDPLLWEMLPREQVQQQQGDELKRMTPEAIERARRSSKATGDVAKQLIGAGMKLVYGSDNGAAGRGFGWYEQLRFENWVTMGFTPAEAIVMATRDAARSRRSIQEWLHPARARISLSSTRILSRTSQTLAGSIRCICVDRKSTARACALAGSAREIDALTRRAPRRLGIHSK